MNTSTNCYYCDSPIDLPCAYIMDGFYYCDEACYETFSRGPGVTVSEGVAIRECLEANGYSRHETGGGFFGWIKCGEDDLSGIYVLITDVDGPYLTFDEDRVAIGIYDDRTGNPLIDVPVIAALNEAGLVGDALLGIGIHDGYDSITKRGS